MPARLAGFDEHRKLQRLVEASLTPMEAIVCATSHSGSGRRMIGEPCSRGNVRIPSCCQPVRWTTFTPLAPWRKLVRNVDDGSLPSSTQQLRRARIRAYSDFRQEKKIVNGGIQLKS